MNDKKNLMLLTKYIPPNNDASQKAPVDIETIFENKFGKTNRIYNLDLKYIRNLDIIRSFMLMKAKYINSNVILFVQWPLYSKKPFYYDDYVHSLKMKRNVAIVHDIDSLRFFPDDKDKIAGDIERLNWYDAVICHNEKMAAWLKKNGLFTKTVSMDAFDYLKNITVDLNHMVPYRIAFAGNLDKSLFIKEIDRVVRHKFYVYGNLTKYKIPQSIEYKGLFNPEELSGHIEGDFGLVWDGESVDSCSGKNGNYMKYNNPHKMSFYISCGMPIITWKYAAIADFVEKNGIGFTVEGLHEIDGMLSKIDRAEYSNMLNNVETVRKKICSGYYTSKAIEKVIDILNRESDR